MFIVVTEPFNVVMDVLFAIESSFPTFGPRCDTEILPASIRSAEINPATISSAVKPLYISAI